MKNNSKKTLTLIYLLGLIFIISGCSKNIELKRSGFYLDNVIEAKIFYKKDKKLPKKASKAMNNAFKKLIELDTNLNTLSTISEISAINSMAGLKNIEISGDTYNLIKKAVKGSIITDGYFDISWKNLIDLFNKKTYPAFKKIEKVKPSIGYLNVVPDKNYYKIRFSNSLTKITVDRIKVGVIAQYPLG